MGKNNKRKLFGSAALVTISLALLVGLTFAWFTDSVKSTGNSIKAGTLDIQLNDGKEEALFSSNDLWEPGFSRKAAANVSNVGSLWLKYTITAENLKTTIPAGKSDISSVLDVYKVAEAKDEVTAADLTDANKLGSVADLAAAKGILADETPLAPQGKTGEINGAEVDSSDTFTLVVKMRESAGNEYQGVGISFDIVVKATQFNYEQDGFGNPDYDKNAMIASSVSSTSDLKDALGKGENVILSGDVDLSNNMTLNSTDATDTTIDLNGKTASAKGESFGFVMRAGDATITNGTLDAGEAYGVLAVDKGESETPSSLNLSDLIIKNYKGNGLAIDVRSTTTKTTLNNVNIVSQNGGGFTTYGTADLYDCTMTQTGEYNWNSNNVSVSNGGTVNVHSGSYTSENFGLYVYNSGGTINVNGGTFKAATVLKADYNTGASTINVYNGTFDGKISIADKASLNIEGGTFSNTGLTLDQFKAYVAEGKTVTENDGTFTVA